MGSQPMRGLRKETPQTAAQIQDEVLLEVSGQASTKEGQM
jgi:hypothetical protein